MEAGHFGIMRLTSFGELARGQMTERTLGTESIVILLPRFNQGPCIGDRNEVVDIQALAAQADLIVSGDKDLLVLKSFQGIPILTAAGAVDRLKVTSSPAPQSPPGSEA